jgi:hypothetical protein
VRYGATYGILNRVTSSFIIFLFYDPLITKNQEEDGRGGLRGWGTMEGN